MHSALETRTLIIGNSGSGKSTLAEHVAVCAACRVIDLDDIHWEKIPAGKKRDETLAIQMAESVAGEPKWVIEGVYGWLAEAVTPRATALVWLNLPWNECKAGLEQRGARRGDTEVQFSELLQWAERYWMRQTPTSFVGHSRIFEEFRGAKWALTNRSDVNDFQKSLKSHLSDRGDGTA